jgi:hypothetical protein
MRAKQPVFSMDGAIQPVRKGCASRCKVVAVASVFGAVTLGAAPEAHAQDGMGALLAFVVAGVALDAGVAVGGLTTGIGSSVHVGLGNYRRGWFISSYVFGGLNLGLSIMWSSLAADNTSSAGTWGAFAAAHGTIAAVNLVMPTIGFVRGQQSSPYDAQLRPVVVGGLDAAGQRWTGAGLQLTGF